MHVKRSYIPALLMQRVLNLLHLPTLSTLVRARGLMEGSGFPQILEDVQREGLTDVSAVSFQV